jgi:poly(3-hydroxybutyrate) depolymerase
MIRCLALAFALSVLQGAGDARAGTLAIEVEGRPVTVMIPDTLGDGPAPLLLALHSGGHDGASLAQGLSLEAAAAAAGFIYAYPDGTALLVESNRFWDAGDCCLLVHPGDVDDVRFLSGVIDALVAKDLADPEQVFLLGNSNGGMLAYRMACERHDLIRGAVVLAGALMRPSCTDASGVAILTLHSGLDPSIPPQGGGGRGIILQFMDWPSLGETVEQLREGGAVVDVILLEGTAHGADALNGELVAQMGIGLADLVARFMSVHGPRADLPAGSVASTSQP